MPVIHVYSRPRHVSVTLGDAAVCACVCVCVCRCVCVFGKCLCTMGLPVHTLSSLASFDILTLKALAYDRNCKLQTSNAPLESSVHQLIYERCCEDATLFIFGATQGRNSALERNSYVYAMFSSTSKDIAYTIQCNYMTDNSPKWATN